MEPKGAGSDVCRLLCETSISYGCVGLGVNSGVAELEPSVKPDPPETGGIVPQ